MELSLLQSFASNGPAILIMAVMIFWFIKQIDKKDLQNQGNLDRFIAMTEKYSALTEKVSSSLDSHINKLEEIHSDIREIKSRK